MVRSLPWIGFGVVLSMFCFFDSFVPVVHHLGHIAGRGTAYYAFNLGLLLASLTWALQAAAKMRMCGGIQRLELRFLIFAFGTPAILIPVLNSAGHYLRMREFHQAGIFLVSCGYAFTSWAITFRRIYDAHQVLLSLFHRLALALLFAGAILGLRRLFDSFAPPEVALLLSVSICGVFVFPAERLSRRWLRIGEEQAIAESRSAVIASARTEANPEKLVASFETLLRERSQSPNAVLLFAHDNNYASSTLNLPKESPGCTALCTLGWATPESLLRRRASPALDDLALFLRENSLGALVAIPHGTPSPSLLIAVGTKEQQAPFTYPEVQRLQVIGELMDNILAHARLAAEAALKAKMEHLALMSRGLAHDLKNLLTPISSFIVHTDGAYTGGTPEAEVHTAAKRSVRLMTDYVREALFFSSRLTPRFEATEPSRVLETVHALGAARAAQRGVDVVVATTGHPSLTADTVLIQRLLGNLVVNAIDASPPGATVTASCSEPGPGRIRFEVEDHGVGIPPENLSRIFEPYFTTKDYGDEARGFGLGLTICEKIVNLHQGSILVKSEPGQGTRVTVDLPCLPTAFAQSPDRPT